MLELLPGTKVTQGDLLVMYSMASFINVRCSLVGFVLREFELKDTNAPWDSSVELDFNNTSRPELAGVCQVSVGESGARLGVARAVNDVTFKHFSRWGKLVSLE